MTVRDALIVEAAKVYKGSGHAAIDEITSDNAQFLAYVGVLDNNEYAGLIQAVRIKGEKLKSIKPLNRSNVFDEAPDYRPINWDKVREANKRFKDDGRVIRFEGAAHINSEEVFKFLWQAKTDEVAKTIDTEILEAVEKQSRFKFFTALPFLQEREVK